MKTILFLLLLVGLNAASQTTGLLENQKDAWDVAYTYIGELKNGKPNGMGIAKYPNGPALRYVGSFVNGMYNGKGTMLFNNGAFLTGNWMNGKLNGRGTSLTSGGALYIGDFKDGVRDGQGILVFKDNSFVKGGFTNDKQSGRCINVWTDGKIISDVIYADDKRNGTGFQYESSSKKLYEGQWTDDKWVESTKASFTSFLQKTDFVGEATSDHVLMGPTGSGGLLKDTSYYYDLKKNKRYFGYYERGFLKNGLIITDSSRFMGQVEDKGAMGYCFDFKFNNYYSEGNFLNDYLEGNILDISLAKKTVYYGQSHNGKFTGKAYFFSNSNNMYYGDYVEGKFNGEGYRLDNNGKRVTGTWKNGYVQKVTSITTKDGKVIPGSPKSFSETLNLIVEDFADNYELFGGDIDELETSYMGSEDVDVYFSLIAMPGANGKDRVALDFDQNNFYLARFIETSDYAKAKAKYDEVAKLVAATTIKNDIIRTSVKPKGTITTSSQSNYKTVSAFTLPVSTKEYARFKISVELTKSEGLYLVVLKAGEQEE